MIDINLFDAVILDMDGTIMDSLDVWEKIDYDFLKNKRNIDVPEDYAHTISAMSFTEIAEYTKNRFNLPDTPVELMAEWTEMAIYEYSNNIKLKKGAREYIEKLKSNGKKVVLCTSSPPCFYEPCLKNNGVYNLFDAFTGTCETGEGKTSTKVFLLAASKAEAEPGRCIVFEDIIPAAQTAKKAGMAVCGVFDPRSAHHKEKLKEICDYYIDEFAQLI